MISLKRVFIVTVYIIVSLKLAKISWVISYVLIGSLIVWALVYGGSEND